MTASLTDLLTEKDQATLAELLNGLITFDPETEISKLFSPAQIGQIVQACYDVRGHGYGRVEIVCVDGKWKGINSLKQNKI